MSLFGKSKESIPTEQPSITKEGIDLSESEQQQINQRITEIDIRIEAIKLIRTDEDKWNKLEDAEAKAIYEEYLKIKSEKEKLQRKLEGKPEGIIAKNKEGKEIEFNLEQIKQYWINFYRQHNLTEIAEAIKNTEIQLTEEQIELLKQKTEQGFDRLMLMPPIETQKQQVERLIKQTGEELKGLNKKQQYQRGVNIENLIYPDIPWHVQINNRPERKPYLLLIKNTSEVDLETAGKTPQELRKIFKEKQETGFTLGEYLVFQRDFTQRHINETKPHPDDWCGDPNADGKETYLLDSELDPQSHDPGKVLGANWVSVNSLQGVSIRSRLVDHSDPRCGARSSVVFEI